MVEKFHEYLYGSTFDVYTDNNPLTYVLTTAKVDTVSLHWVASLVSYNFQLYYRAGKTNIDVDALSRVSQLGCMPNASGTHLQVTVVAVQAVQEATLKGTMSSIEAYSCDLHVLDPVGDGPQVTCMTIDDWCQAQRADPVLGLVIVRLQNRTLHQCQLKLTFLPELQQFLRECNHLKLRQGILYRKTLPRESQGAKFQLAQPTTHRETTL